MDADRFLLLLHIDEELIEISQWLNDHHNRAVALRLNPLIDGLTRLIREMKVEKDSWANLE